MSTGTTQEGNIEALRMTLDIFKTERDLYKDKCEKLQAELDTLKRTMQLHAGDICSLNNDLDFFTCKSQEEEDRADQLQDENSHMVMVIKSILAAAGLPDAGNACRTVIKIGKEALKGE